MNITKRRSCALPLLALLALPSTASSQISIGVSGGVATSAITGDGIDDGLESRTGMRGGAFLSVPLGGIISATTGAYYVQKGGGYSATLDVEIGYFEIPLLVSVEVGGTERSSFRLFAGPQISFETGCEARFRIGANRVDCDLVTLGAESTQFGAIVGGDVRVMTSDVMFFVVDGGLDLGLSDVFDSGEPFRNTELPNREVKHSTWFVRAGVGWTLGG